jgi:hypothetical protein
LPITVEPVSLGSTTTSWLFYLSQKEFPGSGWEREAERKSLSATADETQRRLTLAGSRARMVAVDGKNERQVGDGTWAEFPGEEKTSFHLFQ